jgi:hypothetical protein
MRWCYISMLTSIFHIAPMIKAHDSYIFRTGLEQDVSPILTERGITRYEFHSINFGFIN